MANPDDFLKNYEESAPEKVREMEDGPLDAFHRYFVDLLPYANQFPNMRVMVEQRIVLLANEMEIRRLTKQSDQQHHAAMELGRESKQLNVKALRYTLWTLGVAAASLLVGIVGVCQQRANTQTSKPAPSPSGILPATSPLPQRAQLSSTPSPSPSLSPSIAPTAQPSQSPLKLPPPAP